MRKDTTFKSCFREAFRNHCYLVDLQKPIFSNHTNPFIIDKHKPMKNQLPVRYSPEQLFPNSAHILFPDAPLPNKNPNSSTKDTKNKNYKKSIRSNPSSLAITRDAASAIAEVSMNHCSRNSGSTTSPEREQIGRETGATGARKSVD